MYDWIINQVNIIPFVMIDSTNTEVAGLGGTYTLELQKPGGIFQASAGMKSEISNGWYQYIGTAGEADTLGNIAIKVTAVGCVQQNLLAVCRYRSTIFPAGAIPFTYTLINSVTLLAVQGADVWFSTDNPAIPPPANIIWSGVTDIFGVARDVLGNLPQLDAGTYYVWAQKGGGAANAWPDTEVVS